MEEEIAQLKSVLRSLVVSSPTQVDVRSLMRDYRNMIGSAVPLRKYGYNNPVEFFKERFSDCFLFGGATSNPVLTLIVPETLKHIDKFVQKQRSSNTNKFNPKRRSVPEQLVLTNQEKSLSKIKNRNHISSLPIELSKATHEKSSSPKNRRPTESHVPASKPSVPPTHTESCLSIPTSLTSPSKPNTSCKKHNRKIPIKSVNNVYNTFQTKHNGDINVANGHEDLESKEETDSKTEDIPVSSTDAVKKFLKKRLPMYKSEQHLDEESTEECSKTIPDGASGLYTSSSGSSAKAQQLERLKEEIMVLITDAPDGVWCTDLLPLYRERYNRELNFTRFGYTSILSLVYCLEQQVEITRPEDMGDWLVRERGRAAPPTSPRPRPRPRRPAPPLASPAPRPHHDDDDALPGIDFDPDVFPEDCMHFMESIELTSMSDFQPGAMVEVMVGEVYSPSHFWLIRLGENYNIAMEDMMDEMTQYYGGAGGGAGRVLARGAVRVGHYCASLYERDWHRSLIVKLIDSDTVKVRHIDYGTVDTLGVGALKPLRRCWAALPAQASRARLGGVRPCAGAPRWPHAAATAFLALVSDRRLVANVVAQEPAARLAEVLLIDTAGERDVSLGAELVRAGHADARSDSALHVSSPPSSSSDVSASASELRGRAPRRLRTWEPADHPPRLAPLLTSPLLRLRLALDRKNRA